MKSLTTGPAADKNTFPGTAARLFRLSSMIFKSFGYILCYTIFIFTDINSPAQLDVPHCHTNIHKLIQQGHLWQQSPESSRNRFSSR
jgi:hypothetical protein